MTRHSFPIEPPDVLIEGVPALPAWQWAEGGHTVLWCRHCRAFHLHGAGIDPVDRRIEHCHAEKSPYRLNGYVLVDAGEATRDVLADLKRGSGRSWSRSDPNAAAYRVQIKGGRPAVVRESVA